ncbi:bifunctional hydroxymethylpyrimidine kinase/phosphomethylpyrimidine kinase [candidate division KSB1 bacterium]|nr:bifunctional hydroxymethylpyrimidine kinase/phosphomethylpyrimidine kinase [candidate division KSB1 bacterium]NIS23603.1 bifunctional hydroxymethylpyrimidine kinase/phosphomethylpyrimidine kinase [candidate division KSB1 bacterium]NIT70529.1 bifunctional hydroxymethylpyrimidine kinase/phosphomethylpyrimidine kinase [candidate division KSB1 bacterium]NIU24234.1 bifunctional hydroxymethylpyrimidine kinase/phosphomethylpyrimidine kinase [candidate division KSB1 bacterium]NIU93789.1 bifunctional
MKRLLTIAGSDSGGGAGIQADLKTFHAFGCYGTSVLTAITAQNTLGVHGVQDLEPEFVALQLEAVATDIGVDAAKTGMLSNAAIIKALAKKICELEIPHLVVDPVMRAKGGDPLLREDAQSALIEEIVPLAEIITPNIPEAETLAGITIESREDMKEAAKLICEKGAKYVLVKGGHRSEDALDILYDGQGFTEYFAERVPTKNTHGTGCTYSAAIAANLALGYDIKQAVSVSKKYITKAIEASLELGAGIGPLNHFVEIKKTTHF